MKYAKIVPLACSLLWFALTVPVHADTLFSNFGPAQTYDFLNGYSVGPTCGIGNCGHAVKFSPSATGILGGIDVALAYISGTNSVTVELTSNSGGVPGGILESWTAAALGPFLTDNPTVFLSSPLGLTLDAGTQYWLVMIAGDSTFESWNLNSIGQSSPSLISLDGGASWSSLGSRSATAFDVVTPVPEPSSLLLMGSGLAGFAGVLRRKLIK